MNELGAKLGLGLCVAWLINALLSLVLASFWAVALSAAAAIGLIAIFRSTVLVAGAIALFAPFGVMLPAIALRHMLVSLGVSIPGFSTFELAVFVVTYLGFQIAAYGLVPINLYRIGYAPLPVGLMVLGVCLYAMAMGNWFLALVAVASHATWALGQGSSNWFDHMLHVLLLPVAGIVLVAQIF